MRSQPNTSSPAGLQVQVLQGLCFLCRQEVGPWVLPGMGGHWRSPPTRAKPLSSGKICLPPQWLIFTRDLKRQEKHQWVYFDFLHAVTRPINLSTVKSNLLSIILLFLNSNNDYLSNEFFFYAGIYRC